MLTSRTSKSSKRKKLAKVAMEKERHGNEIYKETSRT